MTVTLRAVEGRVIGPCIYADWGDGFSEETRKDLTLVSEGVYTGVAYTNAGGLRRLRFDPSAKACQFSLEAFSVEPAAESSRPARRLSTARRLARRLLRRLPGPIQAQARSLAGLLRGDLVGRLARTRVRWGGGPWRAAYVNSFEIARNLRSPEFAAPPLDPPRRSPDGPKVIAFYLPAVPPHPGERRLVGEGLTEWTKCQQGDAAVSSAICSRACRPSWVTMTCGCLRFVGPRPIWPGGSASTPSAFTTTGSRASACSKAPSTPLSTTRKSTCRSPCAGPTRTGRGAGTVRNRTS
nr:hypothetical protein [Caulobacter sp. B11]